MLNRLRSLTRSKIVLILLGLVALALAISVGNPFGGVGDNNVARVGDAKISTVELGRQWDR